MAVHASKDGDKNFPYYKAGDTVRVHLRVIEGESERIQVFEGVVLRRRGSGISETFTVRKTSFGVGVERTFPLHSPRIVRIELAKSGRARRARLYYLRDLKGKAARLKEDTRTSAKARAGAKEVEKPKSAPKPASGQDPVSDSPKASPAEAAPAA